MAPTPRLVTYSMNISLDGYIVGPDGGFDWSEPDEEVFAAHTDELRGVGVHLLGRRLHETMCYWETADQEPESDYSTVEWAQMWRAVPKVVFSRTLTEVTGTNTRLATRGLAEEIAALRAESDEGEIALGGAELAAAAEAADNAPLDTPISEDFRVSALALSWDDDQHVVIIEAHDQDPDEIEEGTIVNTLRASLSPAQARAFARRCETVVQAGRPSCPFCGGALDPEGHICPRANGYKR